MEIPPNRTEDDGLPPDRLIPQMTHLTKREQPSRMEGDMTDEFEFSKSALIETEWGYGEGYYRHFYETPETIKWSYGEFIVGEGGIWERPSKTVALPWPLRRTLDAPEPDYLDSLLARLQEVEMYLDEVGSVITTNRQVECCFCSHVEEPKYARSFVLNLTAFEEPTEIRWSSIYWHYLRMHRVLPSRMFAMLILERRLEGDEG